MTPAVRAELERLVSLLVDDALNETEHARLEELLRSDHACRQFYLQYVDLHVRLTQHPRLATLLDGGPVRRPMSAPAPVAAPIAPVELADGRSKRWVPYALTAFMTLAASLLVQMYLGSSEQPP